MTSLRRSCSLCVVAGALGVTMLGTTLPTPLYALYEDAWGFSTLTGTLIFSAYALGVVAALLLLGRTSDVIGRKPVLLLGIACASASDAVFLSAHGVSLLVVGRLLSGVSAGTFTGTATAALVDLSPATAQDRATLVATVASMGGLALGPLVAGQLAGLTSAPLVLPYVVHLGLVALAALGLGTVPETVPRSGRGPVQRPRLGVPAEMRRVFARLALPGFAGFGVLGLFASVGPTYLHQLLRLSGPGLTGGATSVVFAASRGGQVASVRLPRRSALGVGSVALVGGLGLLALALVAPSLPLVLAAGCVAGVGQGITFRVGLTQLNERAPETRRAEVASAFFAVMYAGISLPVVAVGLGADAWGLRATGVIFCLAMAVLCLAPVGPKVLLGQISSTTTRQPPTRHSCRERSEVSP